MDIYTIMVFEKLERNKSGYPDFGSQRVVGFYTNKDDAFHDVQINALDIRECAYSYALIERVEEGSMERRIVDTFLNIMKKKTCMKK